jgi:hypothetical protein
MGWFKREQPGSGPPRPTATAVRDPRPLTSPPHNEMPDPSTIRPLRADPTLDAAVTRLADAVFAELPDDLTDGPLAERARGTLQAVVGPAIEEIPGDRVLTLFKCALAGHLYAQHEMDVLRPADGEIHAFIWYGMLKTGMTFMINTDEPACYLMVRAGHWAGRTGTGRDELFVFLAQQDA